DFGNGDLSPEWGVELVFKDASVHYGPWTDRQRATIQSFFFPSSYRDLERTQDLRPGEIRRHLALQWLIKFEGNTTLRLPTREGSKDWRYYKFLSGAEVPALSASRPYGWLDVKFKQDSYISWTIPMVNTDTGYVSALDCHLVNVNITTSLNYASLLSTTKAEVCQVIKLNMPGPLKWNDMRTWECNIRLEDPTLFLLRDHVTLLQDLVADWNS
ncbi:hypothetical protein M427DRAFT_86251, partial [Gonapodya prolifera JEL478]